jgi:hypothetical protein
MYRRFLFVSLVFLGQSVDFMEVKSLFGSTFVRLSLLIGME